MCAHACVCFPHSAAFPDSVFIFFYLLFDFLSWSDLAVGRYHFYIFNPEKKKAREISGEPEIHVSRFV